MNDQRVPPTYPGPLLIPPRVSETKLEDENTSPVKSKNELTLSPVALNMLARKHSIDRRLVSSGSFSPSASSRSLSSTSKVIVGNTSPKRSFSKSSPSPAASDRKVNMEDIIESGMARDYLASDVLTPVPEGRSWYQCVVVKNLEDKSEYKFYSEVDNLFIMSARREGNTFWISQYETVPKVFD